MLPAASVVASIAATAPCLENRRTDFTLLSFFGLAFVVLLGSPRPDSRSDEIANTPF
jgi:hypothetical protein